MTVKELIKHLRDLPKEDRDLEVRVWLPGSHIAIDGVPFGFNKGPRQEYLQERIVLIEGNLVPGSVLEG